MVATHSCSAAPFVRAGVLSRRWGPHCSGLSRESLQRWLLPRFRQPQLLAPRATPRRLKQWRLSATTSGSPALAWSASAAYSRAPSSVKRSRYSLVEVELCSGALLPFPDAKWNRYNARKPGYRQWICVRALWVLDSSPPTPDQRLQPPTRVQFEIDKVTPVRTYTLGSGFDAFLYA